MMKINFGAFLIKDTNVLTIRKHLTVIIGKNGKRRDICFKYMNEDEIREAAPVTFYNIILLTAVFSIIDIIRRAWMVGRPVNRIL